MRVLQQRRGDIRLDSRVHGSLGRRGCHRPPRGAGDAQQKEIEQKEINLSEHVKISSCQTRGVETEIEKNLNTARRRVELNIEKEEMNQIDLIAARRSVEDQPNETGEMSHEDLDSARRSVEMLEGDPNTLQRTCT